MDRKYWPGVPIFAPSGLRTHICQAPSSAAIRKAANATQKCARQSRSTLRTGNPPIAIRLERAFWQNLDRRPHLAVTEPAIFMARHQQIAAARKLRVHLRDKARHHHCVHVGPGDQDAVNDVGRGETKRHRPFLRHRDAAWNEHELGGDDARGHAAVRGHARAQVMLGELTGKVQHFRVYALHIAGRIDAHGQRGEYHDAQRGRDQHADTERPQQLGPEDAPLVHFGLAFAHGSPDRAAWDEYQHVDQQIAQHQQGDRGAGEHAGAERHVPHHCRERRLVHLIGDVERRIRRGGLVRMNHGVSRHDQGSRVCMACAPFDSYGPMRKRLGRKMQRRMLLRYPRTTTTGMLLWVSTLTVSLPSTIAETPRRPWAAITIASHPLFLAVSIIVSYGCSSSTCTTSQGTPAAVAASFAALRYFAVTAAIRFLYSSGVSVSMPGSTAKTWKGSDTVTAVTLALRAFASPIPWSTAFFDSSDPSVGIRICLYILHLPQISLMCKAARRPTIARCGGTRDCRTLSVS